jgi:hypothetical protein
MWWLKHVVAPLIVGSGIVLLALAITDQLTPNPQTAIAGSSASGSAAAPANSASRQPASPAPAAQTSAPAPASASDLSSTSASPQPSEPPATASPASVPPASSEPDASRESDVPHEADRGAPAFYATDRYDERYHGSRVTVRRGAVVGLHWNVDPDAANAAIHLRSDRNGHTLTDAIVPASGTRQVRVDTSTEWTLVEVRPQGEHFLAELRISTSTYR